jgi:hypothetical protein
VAVATRPPAAPAERAQPGATPPSVLPAEPLAEAPLPPLLTFLNRHGRAPWSVRPAQEEDAGNYRNTTDLLLCAV